MREEITLTTAAFRLGLSYERAKRLLFNGTITGRQHEGKWIVYAESVEAALRSRAERATAVA